MQSHLAVCVETLMVEQTANRLVGMARLRLSHGWRVIRYDWLMGVATNDKTFFSIIAWHANWRMQLAIFSRSIFTQILNRYYSN